jgi:hypothetical protein
VTVTAFNVSAYGRLRAEKPLNNWLQRIDDSQAIRRNRMAKRLKLFAEYSDTEERDEYADDLANCPVVNED